MQEENYSDESYDQCEHCGSLIWHYNDDSTWEYSEDISMDEPLVDLDFGTAPGGAVKRTRAEAGISTIEDRPRKKACLNQSIYFPNKLPACSS